MQAQYIDKLCRDWSCPPSVVLAEDATYVTRMMRLLEMGRKEEVDGF